MSVTVNSESIGDDSGLSLISSSSSQHAWGIPKKKCGHGIEAHVYTSYSEKNPGRRFYRCRFYREDDCKYFEWYDPETPQPYKTALLNMIWKSKTLELQLKQKEESEMIMTEKAESAMRAARTTQTQSREYADAVAQMKRQVNELRCEKENLTGIIKKLRFICWVVMICVLLVVAIWFKCGSVKGDGKFKRIA